MAWQRQISFTVALPLKKGYKDNIEKLTEENNDFRRVLYTSTHSQIVLMALISGEEIGKEIHNENDQFFR